MQPREQEFDQHEGWQRENWLRQKRFALVLSGDDRAANMLVERLTLMGGRSPNSDLSSSAFEYYQLKKLYELWVNEVKDIEQSTLIFQAGYENEAIQKGLDPSLAKILGELPTLHRALLLLIYGENFSYAATAQLLDISIEELMGALASAQQRFSEQDPPLTGMCTASMAEPAEGVAHDAT
ncbi:MAG: hypothetical protein GY927_08370 [bacterium]|nr:hypothetical protein [bacterium]